MNSSIMWALNKYRSGANSLRGCVNDIEHASRVMTDVYGLDPRNMVHLVDRYATKDSILGVMSRVLAPCNYPDYTLITISSHGTRVKDVHNDEEDGIDEALVVWDGLITDDELFRYTSSIPDGKVVEIVVDTCFSGGMDRSLDVLPKFIDSGLTGEDIGVRMLVDPPKNCVIWQACSEGQTSADAFFQPEWRGAFSFVFWNEIRERGLNVCRFEIQDRVIFNVNRNGFSQTPMVVCSNELGNAKFGPAAAIASPMGSGKE